MKELKAEDKKYRLLKRFFRRIGVLSDMKVLEEPEEGYTPFKMEYFLSVDENNKAEKPFHNFHYPWPILCRMTLDNTVLGTNLGITNFVNQCQSPGHDFSPSQIERTIINIKNDVECYFKIPDGLTVPLKITSTGDYVTIRLLDEIMNKHNITFDYKKVRTVMMKKEIVINELSNFLKALYADMEKYGAKD